MLVSFVFSVVIPCASDVTNIFVQKLRPFSGEALSPTEPGVNNPLGARYVSCSELQLAKLYTYLSLCSGRRLFEFESQQRPHTQASRPKKQQPR